MSRERLIINKFGRGMACSVSSEDMDENAAYYCTDVNLLGLEGKLIGVPDSVDKTSSIGAVGNAQGSAVIQDTDGKWSLVYLDITAMALKYISDIYGTPGAVTTLTTSFHASTTLATMIARNGTLRIGDDGFTTLVNKWVGITSNTYFGLSATSGLQAQLQECRDYHGTSSGQFKIFATLGSSDPSGFFASDKTYFYRYALEYDGYQISTLAPLTSDGIVSTSGTVYGNITATIRAQGKATNDFSDFSNKRITGVLVFRAESTTSISPTLPQTEYRLVERIAIDDGSWINDAINYRYNYSYNDIGNEGSTFNVYSGISQEATSNFMSWGIGAMVDNYMFIGQCVSSDLEEAPYLIFRSVAGMPDVFDWQSSTPAMMRLPNKPTAMASWYGKLYVWDENNMYRINPDAMVIEETIPGYGCLYQTSQVVTKYGIFFGDKTSVYHYDGSKLNRISSAIDLWSEDVATDGALTNVSYRKNIAYASSSNKLKMAYCPLTDMVLIALYSTSFTGVIVYGYCVQTSGWTLLSMPATFNSSNFGYITGARGDVYVGGVIYGTTKKLYQILCNEDSRLGWLWVSKKIASNQNDEGQYTKVYYIRPTGSFASSGSVYYGIDGANLTNTTSTGSNFAINNSYRKNKYIRFAISANPGQYVNDITIIYRQMIGVR